VQSNVGQANIKTRTLWKLIFKLKKWCYLEQNLVNVPVPKYLWEEKRELLAVHYIYFQFGTFNMEFILCFIIQIHNFKLCAMLQLAIKQNKQNNNKTKQNKTKKTHNTQNHKIYCFTCYVPYCVRLILIRF